MKHENGDKLPQEIKEFTETRFKRENNKKNQSSHKKEEYIDIDE